MWTLHRHCFAMTRNTISANLVASSNVVNDVANFISYYNAFHGTPKFSTRWYEMRVIILGPDAWQTPILRLQPRLLYDDGNSNDIIYGEIRHNNWRRWCRLADFVTRRRRVGHIARVESLRVTEPSVPRETHQSLGPDNKHTDQASRYTVRGFVRLTKVCCVNC